MPTIDHPVRLDSGAVAFTVRTRPHERAGWSRVDFAEGMFTPEELGFNAADIGPIPDEVADVVCRVVAEVMEGPARDYLDEALADTERRAAARG